MPKDKIAQYPIEVIKQSEIVKGPQPYRYSRLHPGTKSDNYLRSIYDDVSTMYDAMKKGAKLSVFYPGFNLDNGPCVGFRDKDRIHWISYNEVLLRARNLGSGLVSLGMRPDNTTYVGICSINCPNWVILEYALYHYSMVLIPIHERFGAESCSYIINETQMECIAVDTTQRAEMILSHPSKYLNTIISFIKLEPHIMQKCKEKKIKVHLMSDIEAIGCSQLSKPKPSTSCDVALICYTSGTTGMAKGVILTHSNIIASASGVILHLSTFAPETSDIMLSYLPLAFILERISQVCMFLTGGAVAFFSGNMKGLSDDMMLYRPTILPAVPKILNRIYDSFHNKASTSKGEQWKQRILKYCSKESKLRSRILKFPFIPFEELLFRNLRKKMGGRLRLIVVASAPISEYVVLQTYGQTEAAGPVTLSIPTDHAADHVGPPLPHCKIKLVDVPEMNYYSSCGEGEICVKGNIVFQKYMKIPEGTSHPIDQDRWLHTEDIGEWMQNGALRITDRKKTMFKLCHGEYVTPEWVEEVYCRSKFISQCFVHGDSIQAAVVGIVVPDKDYLLAWAKTNGFQETYTQLCYQPRIKDALLAHMHIMGKKAGLHSYEQVADIHLHPDPFSERHDLLTPNLKYKRSEIAKYFKPQIDDMYENLKS